MILGSCCARGGSKGVPGKNLRPLGGVPLIAHTLRSARDIQGFDRFVVSTDDEAIADCARQYGVEVPFMRPAELASDTASKFDVFRHLVEEMERATGERVECLVDLDATVPLRTIEDVEGAMEAFHTSGVEVLFTVYEPERNPYFNMVEIQPDGEVTMAKVPDTPIVRRQDAPPIYSISPAVFIIGRDALDRYEHWSEARMGTYEMPRERAFDIDTPFDFRMAEYVLREWG